MGPIANHSFAAVGFTGVEIGRIAVSSGWRADPPGPADRQLALGALTREAQEFGADSVADIAFAVERCRSGVCEGVILQRLVVTGRPVRRVLG